MADFCKQCSESMFGEDFGDLAWGEWDHLKDSPRFTEDGKPYWIGVLCEGCGPTFVIFDGTCIVTNCDEGHGVGHPNATTFDDSPSPASKEATIAIVKKIQSLEKDLEVRPCV